MASPLTNLQNIPPTAGGVQAAAPPGGGSASLDTPSSYDQNPYRYRITRYPSGLSELVCFLPSKPTIRPASPRGTGPARSDNIRRTKANIRRHLMTLDARYLLTLTTRANITDFQISRDQATRFLRKLRKSFPDILTCGVPERQKRGAWHWHFGVNRRICARTARALWQSVCQDGNIDLQHRTALQVAKYVSKYIGKDVTGDRPGAAYIVSRGIPPPQREEFSCHDPAQAFSHFQENAPDWSGEVFRVGADSDSPHHFRGYFAASWR